MLKCVEMGAIIEPGAVIVEADCKSAYHRLALLNDNNVDVGKADFALNAEYQTRLSRFISLALSGRKDETMLRACVDLVILTFLFCVFCFCLTKPETGARCEEFHGECKNVCASDCE